MKRILMLIILAVILLQSAALADTEGFSDSQAQWTVDNGAVKVKKPLGNAEDMCLRLQGKDESGVWRKINMSGIVTVECSVYSNDDNTKLKAPLVTAVNAAGTEAAIASADIIGNALSSQYFDGTRNTRLSLPLPAKKWNRITIQMDTDKDIFFIWLNGEIKAANKKFINGFDAQSFTKVSFISTGIDGSGYVDDLNIYSGKAINVKQSNGVSQEDMLINENFNSTVVGWNADPSIKQVVRDGDDKCMEIQASIPGKYLSHSLGDITGDVTVEADIMLKNQTTQIKIPDIFINGNVQGALLSVVGENISVPYFAGGKNTRSTMPVTLGEWFKVTVQCSTDTDTFSVWVDGKKFLDNVSFYNGVDAKSISSIRFNVNNQTDPAFYVDNVKAYKGAANIQTETVNTTEMTTTDYLSKMIMMKKDNFVVYKTNYRTESKYKPYLENNKLMVSLDEAADGFYADGGLDTIENTYYLSYHGTDVRVAGNTYYIDGQSRQLTAPSAIKDGTMYVSLEDIAGVLNKDIYFDALSGISLIAEKGSMPETEAVQAIIADGEKMFSEKLLQDASLYVAVDGRNGNGSKEKPFGSIEEAQNAVQSLLREGKTGNITVYLRDGVYYAQNPIRLTSSDSGKGNYTVTYKAYDNEDVLIDGGKRITNWKPYKNGIYMTDVGKDFNSQTMYEDGSRVTIARYPNIGYNRVVMSPDKPKRKFIFKDQDIPVVAKPTELMLYIWPGGPSGHYNWSMSRPKVTALDYTTKTVELDRDVQYEMGTGSRYFTYNAMEFLDFPGEYYVDKEKGILYYMPINPDIEKAVIVAPPAFDLLTVSGSITQPAQNIVLDGLKISGTDLNKNNILISSAQNIVIRNCEIFNSGNNGVYMKGSVRNSTVENCHIYQTGFYGVFAEGLGNTTKVVNYGNAVENCHVHNIGELNGNAAGVRFANTAYCYGANIKINDSPRNALHILGAPDNNLIGKTIDGVMVTEDNVRDFKVSEYNTFEYNDASRCIQDSQDTNAFGAWGIDYFNVLRKNITHDNILPRITENPESSFWFPYYFDENSNGSYILSNFAYDNQLVDGGPMRAAFHNNASKDTTVRGNIFTDAKYTTGVLSINDMDGGVRRSMGVKVTKNIFSEFNTGIYNFGGWNNSTLGIFDFNLFNSGSGDYFINGKSPSKTLEEWQRSEATKSDKNSITADPMFVAEDKRDYRLKYNSPAYVLGFEDINQSDIGLRSDYPFANPDDAIDKAYAYREGDFHKKAWTQMEAGQSAKLQLCVRTAGGYIANSTSYTVKYTSNNPDVASVDEEGKVTVAGKGKTEITIEVTKSGKTISTTYEVVSGDSKITSLNILGAGKTYEIGDEIVPNVIASTEMGRQARMDDFIITTSNPDAVYENGRIKLNCIGQVDITVTDRKNPTISGNITIQVLSARFNRVDITMEKQTYQVGEQIGYSYKLIDTKENELDKTGVVQTVQGDDQGIIVVENGVPVAKKTGLGSMMITTEYQGITTINTMSVAVVPENITMPEGFELMNFTPKNLDPIAGFAYEENGKLYLTTSGNDAWNAEDSCSMVGKAVDGTKKTVISATIENVSNPKSMELTGAKAIHAAGGVMLRNENSAGSYNVFVRYRLNGDVIMSYRTKEALTTAYQKGSIPKKPVEVKLELENNKARGYYKDDQSEWKLISEIDVQPTGNMYAGVAAQSGVVGDFNTSIFSNVLIEQ